MCGILGAFTSEDKVDLVMQEGLRCLSHRGPDSSGVEKYSIDKKTLVLGHARLAIIDLTEAGHQPMRSNDGRFTVVFNGEIYNYKELKCELEANGFAFKSDSDTEVLIACWQFWGESCLRMFKGMFAFVIVDHHKNCLTCVRDAFGIKPLFYIFDKGNLYFASEISAIAALYGKPLETNFDAIFHYLVLGKYDHKPSTFISNIYSVQPGHMFSLNLTSSDDLSHKKWWNPSIAQTSNLSFKEAAAELRRLFLDNVKLHLRSDVPVGAALSGGLDSSAVVCAMRYLEPNMPIHTFTYVAKGTAVDEEEWADMVNNFVGAIPTKIYVSPEDVIKDFDDLVRTQGEPFGGLSIYAQYRVFKAAKEKGIIVTLDGQGADELLAGYHGYPESRFKSLVQRRKFFAGVRFLNNWEKWPGRERSIAFNAILSSLMPKFILNNIKSKRWERLIPSWININKLPRLNKSNPEFTEEKDACGRQLMNALRSSLTGDGLNALLRHADRNAMRWSIESRVPFLTTEMAEFLFSLPEEYLISPNGETKHIFRAAMRGIVPDEILDRRDKIGFATSELDMLKSQKEQINNWMENMDIAGIDTEQYKKHVKDSLNGDKKNSSQVWRMINLSRWLNIFSYSANN